MIWSHDKDGSHTIGSTTVENPMLYAKLMALTFLELESRATKVYTVAIGIFNLFCSYDLDLDPMTFTYELDP